MKKDGGREEIAVETQLLELEVIVRDVVLT